MRGPQGWLVGLALAPLGCFAPAVRPVAMADFGHISATVGGIFPDEDNGQSWLEGSAALAIGILPHVQLEASGVIDQGNSQPATSSTSSVTTGPNWSLGGGLRTAIPLADTFDVQLALLYDHVDTTHVINFCGTSVQSWQLSRETAEVGLVGRLDRSLAIGIWLDGMLDEVTFDSQGGPGNVLGLGARVCVEFRPWPEDLKWLSFVLGASTGFSIATLSGDSNGPYPWLNLGLGASVTL
jgi:hypothetical protein